MQADLFDAPAIPSGGYPRAPGWKVRDTSKAAAIAVAPHAKSIRDQVLDALTVCPSTPEDLAYQIQASVHSIRSRCSELCAAGLIEDSGQRDESLGGKRAIVWCVK